MLHAFCYWRSWATHTATFNLNLICLGLGSWFCLCRVSTVNTPACIPAKYLVYSCAMYVNMSGCRCLCTPGFCPVSIRWLQHLPSSSLTLSSLHSQGHFPRQRARNCNGPCVWLWRDNTKSLSVTFVQCSFVQLFFLNESCINWGFMVCIQALIPIVQTIKNLRRTVFYNLILK